MDKKSQEQALPPLPGRDAAYFFDIDGTLLEIAETPSAVRVDRELLGLVQELHQAVDGALALISGRRIADIEGLFPGLALPLAGQHGIERRDAAGGWHFHAAPLAELDQIRRRFREIAGLHPGVLSEDKGATLALHFRGAPELEPQLRKLVAHLLDEIGDAFRLQPGKMVFEIKPAGKDKGTAIAEFLEETPFCGRTPVFLGDDVTDEYGFRVINDRGGIAVKVGPGDSAAPWRLGDVAAVRDWLLRCLARARGQDR